jgi:hypothetical protein
MAFLVIRYNDGYPIVMNVCETFEEAFEESKKLKVSYGDVFFIEESAVEDGFVGSYSVQ